MDANIRLEEIKSLAEQNLFRERVKSIVFFQFLPHLIAGNIVMLRLLPDPKIDIFPPDFDLFLLGNALKNEIRFQAVMRDAGRGLDQFLLPVLQHFVGNPARPISLNQLRQSSLRLIPQQTRRQIELNLLMQILHDLRFLRSLDLVLFFLPPCKFLLACGATSPIGLPSTVPSKSITTKSSICAARSGTSTKSAV